MASYSLYSSLLLTRALWDLVKKQCITIDNKVPFGMYPKLFRRNVALSMETLFILLEGLVKVLTPYTPYQSPYYWFTFLCLT